MQVLRKTAWQWTPKAAITAADSCGVCTVLALEYVDCALVCVRRNPHHGTSHRHHKSVEEPQHDTDDIVANAPSQDLELAGHSEPITSVCVFRESSYASVTLCSASSDCVIVWQIQNFARVSKAILCEDSLPAEPSSIAFDHTGALVALCCDRVVQVFVVERREVFATLEGHLARMTKCEFHPIRHHLLITCSEDRTFKIWDLAAKVLLFQLAVLSAFAILSLATNPVTGDFAIGFADGTVRIFALLDTFAKEIATVGVDSFLRKLLWKRQRQEEIQEILQDSPNVISSLPPWARSEQSQETAQIQAQVQALSLKSPTYLEYASTAAALAPGSTATISEFKSEVACLILALSYFCAHGSTNNSNETENADDDRRAHFNSHGEQELLGWEQYLVIGTPRHVLCVNAFSFEIVVLQDLQAPINEATRSRNGSRNPVAMAKDFCFYQQDMAVESRKSTVVCGAVSAFQPCFTVFESTTGRRSLDQRDGQDASVNNNFYNNQPGDSASTSSSSTGSPNGRISVLPTGPPPVDSVLNLPSLAVVAGAKLPKKNSKTLDKPVTFHTRIKSSGYGSAPPFGVKKTSIQDRKTPSRPKQQQQPVAATDAFLKEYPSQCGVLQHFQQKHALPHNTLHNGAIHHIEFSNDAKWLATCGSDKVAQVCKLPFSRFNGEGNVFAGHDNAVRAIHWSQSNQMVLTTSSDKSARVWIVDSDVASLTFHGIPPVSTTSTSPFTGKQQLKASSSFSISSSSAKKTIKQDMVDAVFFHMDKFILSGCVEEESEQERRQGRGEQEPQEESGRVGARRHAEPHGARVRERLVPLVHRDRRRLGPLAAHPGRRSGQDAARDPRCARARGAHARATEGVLLHEPPVELLRPAAQQRCEQHDAPLGHPRRQLRHALRRARQPRASAGRGVQPVHALRRNGLRGPHGVPLRHPHGPLREEAGRARGRCHVGGVQPLVSAARHCVLRRHNTLLLRQRWRVSGQWQANEEWESKAMQ